MKNFKEWRTARYDYDPRSGYFYAKNANRRPCYDSKNAYDMERMEGTYQMEVHMQRQSANFGAQYHKDMMNFLNTNDPTLSRFNGDPKTLAFDTEVAPGFIGIGFPDGRYGVYRKDDLPDSIIKQI